MLALKLNSLIKYIDSRFKVAEGLFMIKLNKVFKYMDIVKDMGDVIIQLQKEFFKVSLINTKNKT